MTAHASEDSATPRFLYVISTGRCGTQWLANALGQVYGDCAVVEHEPLRSEYRPKETLRQPQRLTERAMQSPLAEHLARIDSILEHGHYIECGWPAFATVPLFVKRYGARLRLVHLVRHPVSTALSYLTHGAYLTQGGDADYKRFAFLDPFDAGIEHRDFGHDWAALTAYEKALFHWLEVHTWAEQIKRDYPQVPVATVRMEDLFSSRGVAALADIVTLAGLLQRPGLHELLSRRIDAYCRRTEQGLPWQRVRRHPAVLALAARYGYDLKDVQARPLSQRYRVPLGERLHDRWWKPAKQVWKRLKRAVFQSG